MERLCGPGRRRRRAFFQQDVAFGVSGVGFRELREFRVQGVWGA